MLSRREAFEATVNHKEPESVLIDHGKQVSSIHRFIYNPIRKEMGLPEIPESQFKILDRMSQCVVTDEDLLETWGIDFRWLVPNWVQITELDNDQYLNLFGARFTNSGDYYSLYESPLKGKGMEGLENHSWPETDDPAMFAGLREQAKKWYEETDYIIGADGIKGGVLQTTLELGGYDQFFMDLVLDPEYAHALLKKVTETYKEMYVHYMKEVGEFVQCIYLTDDFGSQNSLLMSPDMWREFIKPREEELIAHIKSLVPGIKVIFHTDGSVKPLLNDMIEMGVDILNPVQTSVEELQDTKALNDEFGDRISFHGAIDVQKVLVSMSPEEIRKEVNRRICDLGKGGGYIACTCHNVGHDIPPRNIRAMYEALHEFRDYPLKRID